MNRLNQLTQSYTFGTIKDSEQSEFIEILLAELISINKANVYMGEQLAFIRKECDLLKMANTRIERKVS